MNILNKVSAKNLKLNKKRTISTIIGIILSVALICAVATMATSFQETLVQETIKRTGYFHLQLSNITNENLRELENNRDIESIYTIYENGYATLENSAKDNKPYLKVISMNKTTFDYLKYSLIEGRFPENSNEIIINNQISASAKVDYKIGDKIKLDIGQRETLDNYKLNSHNPYQKDEEQIANPETNEFTVVGIIGKVNSSQEDYNGPGYTTITTNKNTGSKTAYIALKNPKNYKEDIAQILGVSNIYKSEKENLKYEQYEINDELLRWQVFAVSESTVTMLYAVVSVVVAIIVFTSIFCIRNSFAIATAEKIKMYGMLASIGATKKQIRKNVVFEGLVLGVIGIPLGILSGIFACFVLIKIVNMLIAEYLFAYIDGMVLKVSVLPIILSVGLGIITIYLSSISSAIKASRVSPIENLRNSDNIKIKRNKIKAPKIIKKLFKTGGVLAYKNLKRSKKKYRTTVISLAVSVGVFIAMNSVLTYAFGITDVHYKTVDYNLIVYNSMGMMENEKNINRIIEQEDVKDYYMNYTSPNGLRLSDRSKMNLDIELPFTMDYYYDDEKDEEVFAGEDDIINLKLIGYDNATFEKYAKKAGLNPEKVKDTGILYDKVRWQDNGKIKEVRLYKYSQGDIITGKYEDKEMSIKVGAISDVSPYGYEDYDYNSGYLIFNMDQVKNNIKFRLQQIYINSNDAEKTDQAIKKISDRIGVINIEEEAKQIKAIILIVNIFLYGFITVITLIGVTNIFNTITSNMELRQKEFAMLKSIGMTKREFNRMIHLETIFYGTKALIYGIALGLLGTLAIYKAFAVKLDSGMKLPITPIMISVVGVFILIFIIMKYSIHKINKQNTIETIRKENI